MLKGPEFKSSSGATSAAGKLRPAGPPTSSRREPTRLSAKPSASSAESSGGMVIVRSSRLPNEGKPAKGVGSCARAGGTAAPAATCRPAKDALGAPVLGAAPRAGSATAGDGSGESASTRPALHHAASRSARSRLRLRHRKALKPAKDRLSKPKDSNASDGGSATSGAANCVCKSWSLPRLAWLSCCKRLSVSSSWRRRNRAVSAAAICARGDSAASTASGGSKRSRGAGPATKGCTGTVFTPTDRNGLARALA